MNSNKGYTAEEKNGYQYITRNGKTSKVRIPRGLEKYTTDILNIRYGKGVPSKAKQELESLISGEGFTETWTIAPPNWEALFQDTLVDYEGRFRERLAEIQTTAKMTNAQIQQMEANKQRQQNEIAQRMAANNAAATAATATPVETNNAKEERALDAAVAVFERKKDEVGDWRASEDAVTEYVRITKGVWGDVDDYEKDMIIDRIRAVAREKEAEQRRAREALPWYKRILGGRKSRKTRKHRKASKKSRKASKKSRKASKKSRKQ